MNHRTRIGLAILCASLLGGCAAAPIPAAGNSGIHRDEAGDYFAFYSTSLSRTALAAKQALQQLGGGYDAVIDRSPGRIVIAGMRDSYLVRVTLEVITPGRTKVSIRAGYFGKKALSVRFLQLLEQNLRPSGAEVNGPHGQR